MTAELFLDLLFGANKPQSFEARISPGWEEENIWTITNIYMDGNCRAVIVTAAFHSPALKGAFPFTVKGEACLHVSKQLVKRLQEGKTYSTAVHMQILVVCFIHK